MNRTLYRTPTLKHLYPLTRIALLSACSLLTLSTATGTPYVELASYSGKADLASNTVTLKWTTAAQIHNDLFNVYRSKDQNTWVSLTTVQGVGHSTQMMDYSYVDNAPISGSSYYMLEWRSTQGMLNSSTIQITLGKHHIEGGSEVSTRAAGAANVDLMAFNAKFDEVQDRMNITWSTASETNNDRFIVYSSKDQFTWKVVDRVVAAGNSTTTVDYLLNDEEYFSPMSYYKLEWEEANGMVYALTSASALTGKTHEDPNTSTRSTAVSDLTAMTGTRTGIVDISWNTDLEPSSSFALYRSLDQFNWQLVSDDAARSGSKSSDGFIFQDQRAPNGRVHYKLEWYDEYGNVASSTTSLDIRNGVTLYRTYPNPTMGVVNISSNEVIAPTNKVRVISSDGNRHKISARNVNGQLELDLSNLATGVYVIELDKGYARVHKQ